MQVRRSGIVTVVTAAALLVGVASAEQHVPERWVRASKGAILERGQNYYYNSTQGAQAMVNLDSAGANIVQIVPVWWQDDVGSDTIAPAGLDSSPTVAEIRQAIRLARMKGMRVMLKPVVRCRSGAWIGRHDPPFGGKWFDAYWNFIKLYATVAQESSCAMFCIGSALDSTTDEPWERIRWNALIHYTKSLYLGPVTYGADWRTYHTIPFWDSLDMVGINAYFPLWSDSQPDPLTDSMGYFSQVWETEWIPEIEEFLQTLADTAKLVLFTEIGYRSISGSSHQPWDETPGGTFNEREQRHCYMAGLHALPGRLWFAGWFWRGWTTDNAPGGTGDLTYSPRGKRAREAVRRWYAALESQKGINFPSVSATQYGWSRTREALDSFKAAKGEWVDIWAVQAMDHMGSDFTTIAPIVNVTPPDNTLASIVRACHDRGMKVSLKVVACGPGIAWQGPWDPDSCNCTELWTEQWRMCLEHYAGLAERESCEAFCLGWEYCKAIDGPEEVNGWLSDIIPVVRDSFSGPIYHGAHYSGFVDERTDSVLPALWGGLDFVGIDGYFHVFPENGYPVRQSWDPTDTMVGQTPDTMDITRGIDPEHDNPLAWMRKWLPRLDSFSQRVHRPILFNEIGYRNIDRTAWLTACDALHGWDTLKSGVTNNLYAVCFPLDTAVGYIVGGNGTVGKTRDGGGQWSWWSAPDLLDTFLGGTCLFFVLGRAEIAQA